MDALDRKILIQLMKNSRQPITNLAKKVKASREVVDYRVKQLQRNKIILGFVTQLNTEKLGYMSGSCFLSMKGTKEKEFKEKLSKYNFTAWTSEFSGKWNFGIEIFGKSGMEIQENFKLIYREFHDSIIDHKLQVHSKSTMMYEKFLDAHPESTTSEGQHIKLDSKDMLLLKLLVNNARIDAVDLAAEIDLTAPAVATRIKRLQKCGVITNFSLFLDPSKLGLYQFSVFIVNNNLDVRDKLLQYLREHSNVSFIIEYVGDPYIEIGVKVGSAYDVRSIVQEIEESFPDNRVVDMFLIQNEILSIGLPDCVFENVSAKFPC